MVQLDRLQLLIKQARIAFDSGDTSLSIRICQKALQDYPESDVIHHLLSLIAMQKKNNLKALRHIAKAIELKTDQANYHATLSRLLTDAKDYDNALMACEKSISLEPDNYHFKLLKSQIFLEMEKIYDSENMLKEVISDYPEAPEAYTKMGSLKAVLGDFTEAEKYFLKAIEIDPESTWAYRSLATMTKSAPQSNDLHTMEELFTRQQVDAEEKITLGFGIGAAYEKKQQYKKAFFYFSEANKSQRARHKWDLKTSFKDPFSAIRKSFNQELFGRLSCSGSDDETPLFVLGMPRSGTTLTEQILSSHSDVYGAGELDYLSKIIGSIDGLNGKSLPNVLEKLSQDKCVELGQSYIEKIRQHSGSARYIIDKMPGNFQYIGFIKLMLPRAKVIYCMREPADICLSIYKHQFNEWHRYATDLRELGVYHNHFRRLMMHWEKLLPDFIYTLEYENMVKDQEGETRKLLEFCKLPWEDECLQFHNKERPVKTLSLTQVRRPIYQTSRYLWKNYEDHLQPLLEELKEAG